MERDEIINQINEINDTTETYEVRNFVVYRESKNNGMQKVDVEILDCGSTGSPRYHVSGRASDELFFSGNGDDDLQTAIALAHWYELDK